MIPRHVQITLALLLVAVVGIGLYLYRLQRKTEEEMRRLSDVRSAAPPAIGPQGKITLAIPQVDGSIIYVKSNSISSMNVTGTTDRSATIYTKASIYRVDGIAVTTLDGGATLRMDVVDYASGGLLNDEVGFTVLSSKTSDLRFSNRWPRGLVVEARVPSTL